MAMINFVIGKFQFDSIYFPEGDQWKFHARHESCSILSDVTDDLTEYEALKLRTSQLKAQL